MRKVTIICDCRSLADVVNKQITPHKGVDGKFCPHSGERYVPSPRTTSEPSLIAEVELPCPICQDHPIGKLSFFSKEESSGKPTPVD